jgi:hypothetical protein
MEVGMLWFDNSPKKSMAEKVLEASNFYQKKYGQHPDTVHVPFFFGEFTVPGIAVVATRMVPKGHLWIGKEVKKNGKENPS